MDMQAADEGRPLGRCIMCNGPLRSNHTIPQRRKLFHKHVTKRDVQLCQFVIPKIQARRHFGPLYDAHTSQGKLLCMADDQGKVWPFRCCFAWSCGITGGYVLTTKWNEFARDKSLKVGDLVSFYSSKNARNEKQLYIEATPELVTSLKLIPQPAQPIQPATTTFKLFGFNIAV